jgi:hypothetical protein
LHGIEQFSSKDDGNDAIRIYVRLRTVYNVCSSREAGSRVEVASSSEMCGVHMSDETRESELLRLRREQRKTREDEVFLGSSIAERDDYEKKEERIREIDRELREQVRLSLLNAA